MDGVLLPTATLVPPQHVPRKQLEPLVTGSHRSQSTMSIKPAKGVEELQLRNALARPLAGKRHSQAEIPDAGNHDFVYGQTKMNRDEYAKNIFKSKRGSVDLDHPEPLMAERSQRSGKHAPSKVGDFTGYSAGKSFEQKSPQLEN